MHVEVKKFLVGIVEKMLDERSDTVTLEIALERNDAMTSIELDIKLMGINSVSLSSMVGEPTADEEGE